VVKVNWHKIASPPHFLLCTRCVLAITRIGKYCWVGKHRGRAGELMPQMAQELRLGKLRTQRHTHTHTHSARSYQLHRCWRSLSPRLFARGRRLRDDADYAFELSSTRRSVTSQRREQCRIKTGAIGAAASRRQIEGRVRIGHGPGQQSSSRSSSAGESRSITGAVWSGE